MQNTAEILRRLHNLIRLGKVAEVDHAAAHCRIKSGELLTDWLPWLNARAGTIRDWDPPSVDEQVVLLAPGGDLAGAVVVTGLYQAAHSAPVNAPTLWHRVFPDGAVFQYDHASHAAAITLPTGAQVTLISDGGVQITGDITLDGNLKATGEVSDGVRSMAADRDIYNSHTHPGDSGGTTATPNQTQ